MTKRRGRSAYTEEFRREAVRLIEDDPTKRWPLSAAFSVFSVFSVAFGRTAMSA
jgi:hypothetical protein